MPIKISQRLVLNYFTAKRLWGAMGFSLQRHEQTFGVLEIDVNSALSLAVNALQRVRKDCLSGDSFRRNPALVESRVFH